MTAVWVAEARTNLPHLVDAAEAGERVTITHHGEPVAELRPVEAPRSVKIDQVRTPDSIGWIERRLAHIPASKVEGAARVRAMRDED